MRLYLGIMLIGALISSFSQLILKSAALKEYSNFLSQYLNFRVLTAYFMLLGATVASLIAFRIVPLGYAPVSDAAAQVFTVSLSALILKERLTPKKIAGLAAVVTGIVLIVI